MGVERLLAKGREVAFLSSPAVSPTSGPAGIPSASPARHPLAGLLTFRRVGERVVVVVVPADRPIVLPPAGAGLARPWVQMNPPDRVPGADRHLRLPLRGPGRAEEL